MSENENEHANPEVTWGASQEDKRQWAEQHGGDEALGGNIDKQGSTHPGSATNSSEEQPLADLPKAELYEKAKEADIEGRSQMSKEELAKALEEEGK